MMDYYGISSDEVDRTESTEIGVFDIFKDRLGNLRIYREGKLISEITLEKTIAKE